MTIERFSDRLAVYLESQSAVESLRDTDMPQFPWPDAYNPMLEYLVHRSEEMAGVRRPASRSHLAGGARLVRGRSRRAGLQVDRGAIANCDV
ncbi:MAG: hypothetical protein IPL07_20780 [Acidimicrobiaceae bacterium]|nr:hypothetical protein [Acidimicrobiaceae bacterium]